MKLTTALVSVHVPNELATLIVSYFYADTWYDMARNGAYEACLSCPLDQIDEVLLGASSGGEIPLFQYAIARGANRFDRALVQASLGGHVDIAKYLLDKDDSQLKNCFQLCLNMNHKKLLKLFLCHPITNWEPYVIMACQFNRPDILERMIGKGARPSEESITLCSISGHLECLKVMIANGARGYHRYFTDACARNYVSVMWYLRHNVHSCYRCHRPIEKHFY